MPSFDLLFLDAAGWDYDVSTPSEKPLGGSQSALCYLTAELARRGHRITCLTGTSRPRTALGVDCRSLASGAAEVLAREYDALIVLNGPAKLAQRLRGQVSRRTPLVLWTQHAADQPAMQGLASEELRSAWDAVACVSHWHRSAIIRRFGLDPSRVIALRNAPAPAFEALFADEDEMAAAKSGPPTLVYTSTPYRGLKVLISVFPELRRAFPEALLRVYSSMQVYSRDADRDAYGALYELCRATPGVDYRGSIPQRQLAAELRSAAVLAYPCTFAETSCIAALEALAAGLLVVTTDLGALAETTTGYGVLVPPTVDDLAGRYLAALKSALDELQRSPAAFLAQRWEQIQAAHALGTWRVRASEWEAAIGAWRPPEGGIPTKTAADPR